MNADLSIPIIFDEAPTLPQNAALDEYESMEGLSGTALQRRAGGYRRCGRRSCSARQGGTTGFLGSALDADGIALISGLQAVLGAGVTSFDGRRHHPRRRRQRHDHRPRPATTSSTATSGLNVRIGVFAPGDADHTGPTIALHNSMTTLSQAMFAGTINPGQLGIVRTIRSTGDNIADVDRAVFSGNLADYDVTFNADGTVTVAHTRGLATDGTDTIRNVEVLDFADQDILLQAPTLDLHGPTTSTATTIVTQAFRDTFSANAYTNNNGTSNWGGNWTETNDDGSATTGDVSVAGGSLQFIAGTDGNESIARAADLTGVTRAILSFSYVGDDLDGGETVQVQVRNTANPAGAWTPLGTPLGGDAAGNFSMQLPAGMIGANTQIRFLAGGTFEGGENFFIDDVNIRTETDTITPVPDVPGNNYETNFSENGGAVAITAGTVITDDGTIIGSARVVLTNASAGDVLSLVGGLPGGISSSLDTSIPGQIILTLTGNSSHANYQAALQQVRYNNGSENPAGADRILHVTVNDNLFDSAVATTTVHVATSNDAPAVNNDSVITNVAANTSFSISQAALLANDVDPEGSPVTITAVGGATGLTSGPTLGAGVITLADNDAPGGSFTYTGSDGVATDPATVTFTRVNGTINGTGGGDIIIGDLNGTTINGAGGNDNINAGDGGDTVSGGTGDDIILAGTGNDTITWNANANGDTDGSDMVNGEAGAIDTFVVNGRVGAETFRIYTRAAAISAGIAFSGNLDTEIVITRTVGVTTTVIAELDNIEEIRVNSATPNVSDNDGNGVPNGGTFGGDTIAVFGDFTQTSLNFSTITVNGSGGNDTVDISQLTSAHHVVFTSNGGVDTVIGARAQDVVDMNDRMVGTARNDTMNAGAGNDQVFGAAGNDRIETGTGTDRGYGGAGSDTFVARIGDGNDGYIGDAGNDTLDMRAITAAINVDLGNHAGGLGVASSAQSGVDKLLSIENVVTGSGNDVITASNAINVMDGGAGNDVYRFLSAAGANNDKIIGFEPGDKIDLSAIDANLGLGGNQKLHPGQRLEPQWRGQADRHPRHAGGRRIHRHPRQRRRRQRVGVPYPASRVTTTSTARTSTSDHSASGGSRHSRLPLHLSQDTRRGTQACVPRPP